MTNTLAPITPLAIFVNPINGEAITATQNGILTKWIDTGDQPTVAMTCKMDGHGLGWTSNLNFAASPDGETFLIAPPRDESISTYRWPDMALMSQKVFPEVEITTVAASLDGRWLAVGMFESAEWKGLLIVNRETSEVAGRTWAGEVIESVGFDETSHILAAICFTGCDTYVRVYEIGDTGTLIRICEGLTSDWEPYRPPFRNTVSSVAVNGEQNLIAVFAIWTTYPSDEALSIRATCTVCDLMTGQRVWVRTFDPQVISDSRSFQETLPYYNSKEDVVFLNSSELICNVLCTSLVVLDALTGEETRRIPLGHDHGVRSLALDRQRKRLWTVSGDSRIVIYDI